MARKQNRDEDVRTQDEDVLEDVDTVEDEVEDGASAETLKDLVGAVKSLAEAQQSTFKKIPVHLAKARTPWNPSGERRTVKLKPTAVYQNGARLNPVMLSDEEITLLNQVKPGRYNKNKWEVVRRRDKSIDIRFANKSIEQRMEMKGEAVTLTGMLQKILIEQEAQAQRRKRGEIEEDDDY